MSCTTCISKGLGACAMTSPTSTTAPRAAVVGTGLIGGSIGLALRRRGWHVTGADHDEARVARALELGALDAVGSDPGAAVTFIATPAGAVVGEARQGAGGERSGGDRHRRVRC